MKGTSFYLIIFSVYIELDGCKPEDYSCKINNSGMSVKTVTSCYISLELKTKDSQQ